MKLKYLGTSATEGLPAAFCNCPTCNAARKKGGKNIRTRSQILIDSDVLFDFPMDTYAHSLTWNVDLSAIKYTLITHTHMDHCYPQEFCNRGAPFSYNHTEEKTEVFCNDKVKAMFLADTKREIHDDIANNITVTVMKSFDRITRGDVTFTAIPACHTPGEECLLYIVERAGKAVALLNDTGTLKKEVYQKLFDMGIKLDGVSFDCTYGAIRHGEGRHMGLYDDADQLEIMKSVGLVKKDVKAIATHFSHNSPLDYDGLVVAAKPYGIIVAYDGMEIEI